MVKQGDRVSIGGTEAVVETTWGQGRHTAFKLTDGRVLLDLHLREDVEVVREVRTPRVPIVDIEEAYEEPELPPEEDEDEEL